MRTVQSSICSPLLETDTINRRRTTMTKNAVKYLFVAWLLSDEIKWVANKVSDLVHGKSNKNNEQNNYNQNWR
jgi:hypothetical protein